MSERGKITLEQMQDECRKHEHGGCLNCTKCNPVIKKICDELNVDGFNLIDLAELLGKDGADEKT